MENERFTIKRRKTRCCLIMGLCALILLVILAISLWVAFSHKQYNSGDSLKETIISRCQTFIQNNRTSSAYDCQKIWTVFEQAFVGKDPCNVPTDAYDSLINTIIQDPICNKMLFWSKTKHIVHEFTEKRNCFQTLEDTLLGYIMDGLTWCGKEGSNETFTTGCPSWNDCVNHTVKSFWNRASAAFAEAACGDVSAMLNGSIATPFTPTSIFASIEVKRFNADKMRSLTVFLVTQENDGKSCDDPSLKNLQKELDPKLKYSCVSVAKSTIQECISHPDTACGACW
ncbi:ADP-ribosyl cyclase/cyclic ADP-ribose hydrolase 1 [Esox lucius]|uniref:ADP-ribosyl cyclase/cyclic ADP-ribose hydrolase n=1 Tax=Esox lucius TaxID=8010 RepID=A0A6Q2X484_ESOLU|nr:ADP-ribosyl cyclase/cyclic ADP-ribose hydrolase 1 [Esox lucius]XP_019899904.2 ADP-ribosyl cyclase/cyclic ADP-ribose hydrolase 1 [Esox lucius]